MVYLNFKFNQAFSILPGYPTQGKGYGVLVLNRWLGAQRAAVAEEGRVKPTRGLQFDRLARSDPWWPRSALQPQLLSPSGGARTFRGGHLFWVLTSTESRVHPGRLWGRRADQAWSHLQAFPIPSTGLGVGSPHWTSRSNAPRRLTCKQRILKLLNFRMRGETENPSPSSLPPTGSLGNLPPHPHSNMWGVKS